MIPGSLNTMLMGKVGGGTPQFISHDWSSLAPFVNPSPLFKWYTEGGGFSVASNRLVANGYGTGSGWYGPTAYLPIDACTDFEFSFIYSFVDDGGVGPVGDMRILLQNSSTGQSPFAFNASDSSAASRNRTTGVYVNNLATAAWYQTNATNRTNTPVIIRRKSGVLSITFAGSVVYSGTDYGAGSFDAISIQFARISTAAVYSVVNIGPMTLEYL